MRNTKRRMTASLLALLVCCVMLAGTTFAWFTDTASNRGNNIQAGRLIVDLLKYVEEGEEGEEGDYVSIKNSEGDIFALGGNGSNWEPGKTEIVYLAVRNLGTLALKYNINLDVATDEGIDLDLASQFEYAVIGDQRYAALSIADNSWADIIALAGDQTGNVNLGEFVAAAGGQLRQIVDSPEITEPETKYFALAVHMKETAGNEYMNGLIHFDVIIDATQLAAEVDSFSDQYDAAAPLRIAVAKTVAVEDPAAAVTVEAAPATAVEIPAGALPNTAKTVTFSVKGESAPNSNVQVAATQDSQSYDIALIVDGAPAPTLPDGDAYYTVTLNVGKGLDEVKVYHKGDLVAAELVTYNRDTGDLTIKTKSFSPFDIVFNKPVPVEVDAEEDFANLLTGKTYKLVENVTLTKTLIVDKAITLDLNGKTLTAIVKNAVLNKDANGIIINEAGSMTLNDSVGNGKITNKTDFANGNYCLSALIECYGKFVMNNGTIETAGLEYWGFGLTGSNCDVTINGGKLINEISGVFVANGQTEYSGYKLTINGGEVSGLVGAYLPSAGTTVINGGKITTTAQSIEIRAGKLTMTGGTITTNIASNHDAVVKENGCGKLPGTLVAVKPAGANPDGYYGDIDIDITGGKLVNQNDTGDAIVVVNKMAASQANQGVYVNVVESAIEGGVYTEGTVSYNE